MDRKADGQEGGHGGGAEGALRRILLWLVVIGSAGLLLELALLEHFDSVQQWIPLAVLGLGLLSAATALARPGRGSLKLFRVLMGVCILTALVGLYLHYAGNLAFELEMDPDAAGPALIWMALRGATPALAPGAMAQLGLLGLVAAYRHPALASASQPH